MTRTIMVLLVVATSVLADEPRWEVMPDLPVGVFNAAASVVGRKIVVTGGLTGLGQTSTAVQVFDTQSGQWSIAPSLRYARHSHAQTVLPDGRIVVFGGEVTLTPADQGQRDTLCEVLPASLDAPPAMVPLPGITMTGPTAHTLPDGRPIALGGTRALIALPTSKIITLRQARTSHVSAMLKDGRILVVGGTGRDGIELIDVTAGITKVLAPTLPNALDDLAIAVIDARRVWIIGGQESRSGHTTDRTWILTLHDTGKSELADGPRLGLPGGLADHVTADLGDHVVVAGGESEQGGIDTELMAAWLLDKKTLTVTRLPNMISIHDDACAVVVDGEAWVIGGYATQPAPFGLKMKVPSAVRRVERLNLGDPPR